MLEALGAYLGNDITPLVETLQSTTSSITAQLKTRPIVLIPYRRIPLLREEEFAHALLHQLRQATNSSCPLAAAFVLHSSGDAPTFADQVARTVVQTLGSEPIVIVVADQARAALEQSPAFRLWGSHVQELGSITDNPARIFRLLHTTPPRAVTERRLAEVLFVAACLSLDAKADVVSILATFDSSCSTWHAGGKYHAYIPWNLLPKLGAVGTLHVSSFSESAFLRERMTRCEPLYNVLSLFRQVSVGPVLERIIDELPSAVGNSDFVRLVSKRTDSPSWDNAISGLVAIVTVYLLAQSQEPLAYMGGVSTTITSDPRVTREAQHMLAACGIDRDLLLSQRSEDLRLLGHQLLRVVHMLAVLTDRLDLTATFDSTVGLLSHFAALATSLTSESCLSLMDKSSEHAVLLAELTLLAGRQMPKSAIVAYRGLWQEVADRVSPNTPDDLTVREVETRLQHLRLLGGPARGAGGEALLGLAAANTRRRIKAACSTDNALPNYLDVHYKALRQANYTVDSHEDPALTRVLAQALDQTQQSLVASRSRRELVMGETWTILRGLQSESTYDRVYMLVIDAMSYAEWLAMKAEFEGELSRIATFTEDVSFAPLPTYTPCALTALLTGIPPLQSGIWDWSVMTGQGAVVELNSDQFRGLLDNPCGGPPGINQRNRFCLVHNCVGTGLSNYFHTVADIEEYAIPSTDFEKAIARVREVVLRIPPTSHLVVMYIGDMDEFGHKYIRLGALPDFYRLQGERILRDLLEPIRTLALQRSERVLVVLTSDHGKVARYDTNLIATLRPPASQFSKLAKALDADAWGRSPRHILGRADPTRLEHAIRTARGDGDLTDVLVVTGTDLEPGAGTTSARFRNPNFLILAGLELEGHVTAHGGVALSEVVVPVIRFDIDGR